MEDVFVIEQLTAVRIQHPVAYSFVALELNQQC